MFLKTSCVWFAVLFLLTSQGESARLCHTCDDIRTGDDCIDLKECSDQECFTSAKGFPNGEVRYTLGCKEDHVHVQDISTTFCIQFCSEDMCNLNLCHLLVTNSSQTRPPRCHACDFIRNPRDCKKAVQCHENEVCFVRKFIAFGKESFRLGCMNTQHCGSQVDEQTPIVGRRATTRECSVCCYKDYCNAEACLQIGNTSAVPTKVLNHLGDNNTCNDSDPFVCSSFGMLDPDACKHLANVDVLCPESCGICGHFGWSQWGAWSNCSATCNNGTSQRYRKCLHQLRATTNKTCNGPEVESTACNYQHCAVDGQWSEWGRWSDCLARCGSGSRIRERNCSNPQPQHMGHYCSGHPIERTSCYAGPCPIDGQWSNWGEWGKCLASCGIGTMTRKRNCSNPQPQFGGLYCFGYDTILSVCNTAPCPAEVHWLEWEHWSNCSVSCGNGTAVRRRRCVNSEQSHTFSHNCLGENMEISQCRSKQCPVDGGWCYTPNDCYIDANFFYHSTTCFVNSTGSVYFAPYLRTDCNCPRPINGGKNCT